MVNGTKKIFNTGFANSPNITRELEKRDFSADKPILIEDYYVSPYVGTIQSLMKVNIGNKERIMVMALNIALVKNRIIYIAYYKDYEGTESIKNAKAKNDYFVLRFMDENK